MSDVWQTGVAAANAAGTKPAEDIPGTPEWTKKRDDLIVAWQSAKTTLEAAKNSEREARDAVVAFVWPDEAARRAGVNNHELGNGYVLKFGNVQNYSFGDNSNDKIEAVMDAIESVGNVGAVLVDRLVKTKYEPSMTEYKALGDTNDEREIKRLFDSIFVTKPGAPQLELKEPKAKLNG